MLFDLRGRGRRRVTRIVYIGLALLIGVGLVGFGIGGGFGGGGLLNAATSNEGSNSVNYQKQITKYRKLTQSKPQDSAAWAGLTLNLLHEGSSETYVTSAGLTSKGHAIYKEITQAWSGYIASKPKTPSLALAKEMLLVYGEEGLNEPKEEVSLLQIIVGVEPNKAAYYGQLAEYAYKAHDTSLGNLAGEKYIALEPAADRKKAKTSLEELKKAIEKESSSSSSSAASSSAGATVSTPEGTVTTNTLPSTKKTK